jgi:hypothetical protein
MSGKINFPGKIVSVFFDMEHRIGKDFNAGLNELTMIPEK